MKPKGFTLVECLTAMALGLFIFCAALEFFVSAEKLFFKLKAGEEGGQAVLAALDKISIDLHRSGQDLVPALKLGLVAALDASENILTVRRGGRIVSLAEDAGAGDARLTLSSVTDMRPGRWICLWDESKGEVGEIAETEAATRSVVLVSPLAGAFRREASTVALVEETVIFMDGGSGTLRRRVNLSSAQPLLDDVAAAEFTYDPENNLAVVRLRVTAHGGRVYETSVFPKNPGAAR